MKFLVKNKKTIWWLILFISTIMYIVVQRESIFDTPNDIDKLIVIISIFLAMMPLIQEMSFAGLSIKREIKTAKEEFKTEAHKIKLEMMQFSINNSMRNDINIGIGNEVLPSNETIENDLKTSRNSKEKRKTNELKDTISDDIVYLFKSRYLIEERINSIASKYKVGNNRSIKANAMLLLNNELINRKTYEYINRVLAICNSGIHGEIIDEHYIDYVKEILPEILSSLSAIRFSEMANTFHICNYCGYSEVNDFDKNCPNCGQVLDEYK